MSLDDAIKEAVRAELRPLAERIEAALAKLERGTGDQYLSLDDASAKTGLSKTTLRAKLADGALTRYGVGRAVRLRWSELERLLREQGAARSSAPSADAEELASEILLRRRRR